jgi:PAS domain S-box-containing protein
MPSGGDDTGALPGFQAAVPAMSAEDALRASEARYRLLLEHAPVGMYVHDGQKVLLGNRAFAELMGANEPAELVGYPVMEIAHPDERPRLLERIRAVAAGLVATAGMDFRAVRLDGTLRHVRVMGTTCVYEGRPAVQVVIIDETERRAAELERDALAVQLLHAQRLEALGTLAGGVAHDFNNMLTVIVTNAELAKTGLPAEHESRSALDEVLVATTHASELVRSILAFSRKQPLERRSIQLVDAVQEAVRLLRPTMPSAISIHVEPATGDSSVVADPTQVHQVLMNLCTNAWHAIGKERAGEIRISVESVVLDEAGARAHPDLRAVRYVCIRVRDNGVGMDQATLARAFDPFFTTKETGRGTGLGLSVVHGILKGHGGAVMSSSKPGEGTELRLFFPADEPSVEPVAQQPRANPSPIRKRIMIVDDEPALRAVILRALSHAGFEATAHPSVSAALSALGAEPAAFDLLITDYNMAGGSGLDLARAVRAILPSVPIVLISGYLDDKLRAGAEELGLPTLLPKPFTIDELITTVNQALEHTT